MLNFYMEYLYSMHLILRKIYVGYKNILAPAFGGFSLMPKCWDSSTHHNIATFNTLIQYLSNVASIQIATIYVNFGTRERYAI